MNEKIKDDVLNFFNSREYHREDDTNYQIDSFELLTKLKVPFEKDFDLRNYSHSVGAIIDYNGKGELLNARSRIDLESTKSHIELHGEIISVFISFSDVGKYIMVFGNRHWINELGEVKVDYMTFSEIETRIRSSAQEIIDLLIKELNYVYLKSEFLNETVAWLEESDEFGDLKFETTIGELLFGGFELYSKLGI